jgi:hypothetical protein
VGGVPSPTAGAWGEDPHIRVFPNLELLLAIGGIVDRGVMIGAGAVILLVVFLLAKPLTEVIGASS